MKKDNMTFLPLAIYLHDSSALVISDIHIGFESFLNRQGIQLPWNSYPDMKKELENYLDFLSPDYVIINGDLKEYLVSLSFQEESEIADFIDTIHKRGASVKFVRGNHDNFVLQMLENLGVECHERFLEIGSTFITHGHMNLEEEIKNSSSEKIIIGHEHASILIRDNASATHKFKVIAEADWDEYKKIYALPAFSPLKSGCELNTKPQQFLSPLLKKAKNFTYHLCEENEWFSFDHKDIT